MRKPSKADLRTRVQAIIHYFRLNENRTLTLGLRGTDIVAAELWDDSSNDPELCESWIAET